MNNSLQIDFLSVSNGEKSGDAIALRYGDFSERKGYQVVIIDGGTKDSGNRLVEHVQKHFNTNHVDLVICTHPDADHASGLRQVINQCSIGEIWIHKPWEYSTEIRNLFHDGRITDNSLEERIKEAYNFAHEIVLLAVEKGIDVREPFAGRESVDGALTVLGPTTDYYKCLLPEFTKTPQAKTVLESATNMFNKAIDYIGETLNIETLDESGETSAENKSSAVILLQFDGEKYLFTGDAGIESLNNVLTFSNESGINISKVKLMQVPHHGSKRNISPSILNAIKCDIAYVSASENSSKHPAKKVVNAYIRRGSSVYKSGRHGICYEANADRGWGPATPLTFSDNVAD